MDWRHCRGNAYRVAGLLLAWAQMGWATAGTPAKSLRLQGPGGTQLTPARPTEAPTAQPPRDAQARGWSFTVTIGQLQAGPAATEPGVAGDFRTLRAPAWSLSDETGKPAVPFRVYQFALPEGVDPEVSVTNAAYLKVENIRVRPAQPPLPDRYPSPPRPAFQMDAATYGSDELYPAQLVRAEIGQLRNTRILTLMVTPVQVRPRSREAWITDSCTIQITWKKPVAEAPARAPLPESSGTNLPVYMILAPDALAHNTLLEEFVEWKKRKGYDTRLVRTSAIKADGAPAYADTLAYLRGLSAAAYPEYLLIIGDHTRTNGVEGCYITTDEGGYSDLYFSCRDAADYLPDLYCGRLPATTPAYLSNMLARVMQMDRHPGLAGAYMTNICVAGQVQDSDDHNNIADRLFCETADLIACYFEQHAAPAYQATRALVNPDGMAANGLWNANSILWNASESIGTRVFNHFISNTQAIARIVRQLNEGVGILQHRDHGYAGGWGDPNFTTSHVTALTNGNKMPVVFSINCLTGSFHTNRFLRAWFQNAHGGAYAVFAPVDVSYSWHNDWLTHGFYTAFLPDYLSFQHASSTPAWSKQLPAPSGVYGPPGAATRLGQILNFGKMYYKNHYTWSGETTFQLFHVFGDPESFLWHAAPQTQSPVFSGVLPVGAAHAFAISGLPAQARVALYGPHCGVHQAQTVTGGVASFTLTLATTGTVCLTSTAPGYAPYEATLAVAGSAVALTHARQELAESAGQVPVSVIRVGEATNIAVVDYHTVPGTAMAGSDYIATNGTLVFAVGETQQTVYVSLVDDLDAEDREEFSFELGNAVHAELGAPATLVLVLESDDGAGQAHFEPASYAAPDAAGQVPLTVVRRDGWNEAGSIHFATSNQTALAGRDYVATNGWLELAPGETQKQFFVQLLENQVRDESKTFSVHLATGALIKVVEPATAHIELANDDDYAYVRWQMDDRLAYATSGMSQASLIRNGNLHGTVQVHYATADGSALAGRDYAGITGSVVFLEGQTNALLLVPVMGRRDRAAARTFVLHLSGIDPSAQIMGAADCPIHILDGTPAELVCGAMLSQSPGWATQGAWAFGPPQGQGGAYGQPDPAAGYSGPYVYGYNLAGDYVDALGTREYLTTPAFNCAGLENTTLQFMRFLNVENSRYDHATIEISTNGTAWTELWHNPLYDDVCDAAWTQVTHDLSAYADGQAHVQVRWGLGPTDAGWTYSGWNLDDVFILGDPVVPEGLVITNPPAPLLVSAEVAAQTLEGTLSVAVQDSLRWSNCLTGAQGSMPGVRYWQAPAIPLGVGSNQIVVSGIATSSSTLNLADDTPDAATYDGGWSGGQNGGTGFGAWTLNGSANAGCFLADIDNHANLDIGQRGWGLWANSGAAADIYRNFNAPLAPGDTFHLKFDNNWIEANYSVGFGLQTAGGANRFEFMFIGGETYYRINELRHQLPTPINWTDQGLDVALTLASSNTYRCVIGMTVITGTLATATAPISRLHAWNYSAGPGTDYNFYLGAMRLDHVVMQSNMLSHSRAITRQPGAEDADGDGLPDWWEQYYYGNPTNSQADADGDGDYMSNREECLCGTDPTRSNSFFRLDSSAPTPMAAGILLHWPSASNRHYALEGATNLLTSQFLLMTSGIPATPPINCYTDRTPLATGPFFYRVLLQNE